MARASFSSGVKGELARIYPEKDCCRLAELAAIARQDGTVTIGAAEDTGFYFSTEYSAIARKVYRLVKDLFALDATLTVSHQSRFKRRRHYVLRLEEGHASTKALISLGLLTANHQILPGIKKDLVRNKCCGRAYLRGAFLGGGSVNSPKSDYHLELSAANEKFAGDLVSLINRHDGLHAKISQRRRSFSVYMKDSGQIADFLTLIGAHSHLLEFENTRVLRGMKDKINRIVNLETANLGKTSYAASKQVSQILLIDKKIGLDTLEPSLAQVARLRLENPDVNLKELGEIMTPPLGKSGVNHRLRKIGEIADQLADA